MSATMEDLTRSLTRQSILFSTQSSPDFDNLRDGYAGIHNDRKPSLIVQPKDEHQAAAAVKESARLKLPVTVLCGRHDLFGRYTVKDAVAIDVRALNKTTAAEDGKSAVVQGGSTILEVLEALDARGLHLPVGNCGDVGFTSWSMVGGIGTLVNSYGYGADQILGVRYVDAKGELVDATDEVLAIFRGGGIAFGVVVSITVKTYPMNGIQVAQIAYESSDISKTIKTFYANYEALVAEHDVPGHLQIWPILMQPPGAPGIMQLCTFFWDGHVTDETYTWLDRVVHLAPPMLEPGQEPRSLLRTTTTFEFLTSATKMVPKRAFGVPQAVTWSRFSGEAVDALAKVCSGGPEGACLALNFHIIRPTSPSCSASLSPQLQKSVLPYRKPGIVVEILPFAGTKEAGDRATPWAREVRDWFARVDAFEGTRVYVPLVHPDFLDTGAVYGRERVALIKGLKEKHDPHVMFPQTLPGLREAGS